MTDTKANPLALAVKALPPYRRREVRGAFMRQAERSADRHDMLLSALWVALADVVLTERKR